MSDPLSALRTAIKAKSLIKYTNGVDELPSLAAATHILLSSTSFPKSLATRLQKPDTTSRDPASNSNDFYSLEAVYLAWLYKDAPGAEYMKHVRESGLFMGFVGFTERKALVDWLEGTTSHHERIISSDVDSSTPPGTPSRQPAALPATPSGQAGMLLSPSKRRYVPDAADAEVVKKIKSAEVELRDRMTVLRGVKPNNFSSLRDSFGEKLKILRDASKNGTAASAPSTPKADPKLQARKARHMYPIIMISSSPTSLITMHNVKRFLQDAAFEPASEARARAITEGNARPEDMIPIYRKRTMIDPSGAEREIQARYFIVDGVDALSKFGTDAWDRVVCVLTTGQAWQFRPYKWNDPIQLFHHVKGFYVTWSNDPPNPKIKDWNVTELKIDPHRRHVDKSVVAHFWKTLDTWTMANKPSLMQS